LLFAPLELGARRHAKARQVARQAAFAPGGGVGFVAFNVTAEEASAAFEGLSTPQISVFAGARLHL
jgi:hypothetical protein